MTDSVLYGFWKPTAVGHSWNHPLKIMFSYQLCYSTTTTVNNSVYHNVIGS